MQRNERKRDATLATHLDEIISAEVMASDVLVLLKLLLHHGLRGDARMVGPRDVKCGVAEHSMPPCLKRINCAQREAKKEYIHFVYIERFDSIRFHAIPATVLPLWSLSLSSLLVIGKRSFTQASFSFVAAT